MEGKKTKLINIFCLVALGTLVLGTTGCTARRRVVESTELPTAESYVNRAPGAVEFVWEPPMIDVVDVPPGLDPEGHYYRPAHQSIVQIRQGKWRYYKLPEDK